MWGKAAERRSGRVEATCLKLEQHTRTKIHNKHRTRIDSCDGNQEERDLLIICSRLAKLRQTVRRLNNSRTFVAKPSLKNDGQAIG